MTDDQIPDRKPTPKRSLVSRTSVVTMLAIGGVALAGTAAIAANIGILNSTSDDQLGTLTAGQLESVSTPAPQVIDVFVDDVIPPTSTTPAAPSATSSLPANRGQDYRIDDAGVVTAEADGALLRITNVAPSTGWTWTMSQERPDTATLVFTGAGRTLVFTASLGSDGTIRADVTEPVVVTGNTPTAPAVTAPAAPVTAAWSDDDDHDDDEYEYDDDHDEYDDDEYEDDDDHDEYEGGDDDD